MRKFLTILLALLLCAGIGGAGYALYKTYSPDADKPVVENPVETPDDGDSNSGTQTPTENTLTAPANESSIVESRMEMQKGAQAFLGDDGTETGALRFMLKIETA